MIKITMTNGNVITWGEEAYTDYKYDGKFFIIIRDEQWVGFYNLDHVFSIEVDTDETDELEKSEPDGLAAVLTQDEINSILSALRDLKGAASHG